MNLWDAVTSLFRRKPKPVAKPVAGAASAAGRASALLRVVKRLAGVGTVQGRASGSVGLGRAEGRIDVGILLP